MPAAEVDIDIALVQRLLEDQHRDLLGLPLSLVANGWDNVLVRLGKDLAVRLPRHSAAAVLVANEIEWLPLITPGLPLPVPEPVRVGGPTDYYPFGWTVVPWFEGHPAGAGDPIDTTVAAETLGGFVAALHRLAPMDAPLNPWRGGPLEDRDDLTMQRLRAVEPLLVDGGVSPPALADAWRRAAETPRWDGAALWLHGDLHPMNIVASGGYLAAVIDFGDITSGDPATDLLGAWSLFGSADRAVFRSAAASLNDPIDDHTWQRGRGWAVTHSLAILSDADSPAPLRTCALRALREASTA